jgi:hypothetical protein
LVDQIQAGTAGSFGFYSPNDEFSPRQVDTLKTIEVNWAFAQSHYVIVEETATLNEGDPDAYLSYVDSLEMGCIVDTVNGLEEALWAAPNSATMESASADPRVPYSLLCFNTRSGTLPATGVDGADASWTTLQTINPTTDSWFQNATATYDDTQPDNLDAGLLQAMDLIVMRTGFEMPDALRKYSTDDALQKHVIVTNEDGIRFYKARLRAVNDRMERLVDPSINGPQFGGVPLKYVSELDDLWTAGQPDYLFYNLNYLWPWFHATKFMAEKIADGGAKQPNTTVVYKFSWYNLICRSRRRQGRVYAS